MKHLIVQFNLRYQFRTCHKVILLGGFGKSNLAEAATKIAPLRAALLDGSVGPSSNGSYTLMSKVFFHDLQCRSGLGDRLLDLWAARTIASLHDPHGLLAIQWHRGLRFASFVGDYSTEAFAVAGCMFVETPPYGAVAFPGQFSHVAFNDRGMLHLPGDVRQVVLRAGMIWGNSPPERLHADLAFYALDPSTPLAHLIATYRSVASSTLPVPSVRSAAPRGIDGCVGVHVRLGDKLVPQETAVDMSEPTWRALERQTLAYLDTCIAHRRPLFVCSDDTDYRAALIDHLRARGGAVISSDPAQAPREFAGSAALVDFFALARCSPIVQMTKYSTFSLAAALAGNVPLINFFHDRTGAGHRLDIWRSTLAGDPKRQPLTTLAAAHSFPQ